MFFARVELTGIMSSRRTRRYLVVLWERFWTLEAHVSWILVFRNSFFCFFIFLRGSSGDGSNPLEDLLRHRDVGTNARIIM